MGVAQYRSYCQCGTVGHTACVAVGHTAYTMRVVRWHGIQWYRHGQHGLRTVGEGGKYDMSHGVSQCSGSVVRDGASGDDSVLFSCYSVLGENAWGGRPKGSSTVSQGKRGRPQRANTHPGGAAD